MHTALMLERVRLLKMCTSLSVFKFARKGIMKSSKHKVSINKSR